MSQPASVCAPLLCKQDFAKLGILFLCVFSVDLYLPLPPKKRCYVSKVSGDVEAVKGGKSNRLRNKRVHRSVCVYLSKSVAVFAIDNVCCYQRNAGISIIVRVVAVSRVGKQN